MGRSLFVRYWEPREKRNMWWNWIQRITICSKRIIWIQDTISALWEYIRFISIIFIEYMKCIMIMHFTSHAPKEIPLHCKRFILYKGVVPWVEYEKKNQTNKSAQHWSSRGLLSSTTTTSQFIHILYIHFIHKMMSYGPTCCFQSSLTMCMLFLSWKSLVMFMKRTQSLPPTVQSGPPNNCCQTHCTFGFYRGVLVHSVQQNAPLQVRYEV